MFLLFRKAKRMVEYPTTMAKICDYIAQMPASCYYLADSTAYRYICKRIKGEKPKFGKYQAMKEKLFEAFYQDFLRLRQLLLLSFSGMHLLPVASSYFFEWILQPPWKSLSW